MGITAFVIYKISTLSLIRTFELDYLMKSRRAGRVGRQAHVFPGMFWSRQEGHIDDPTQKPPLDTPTVALSSRGLGTIF
jgi:hypothetical protein